MPTLFVADLAWETHLQNEIARALHGADVDRHAPGWLLCQSDFAERAQPQIALASQVLPHAEPFPTPSINKTATALGQIIVDCLADHKGPWRLHVFTPSGVESSASGRRCQLIEEALDQYLAKKQRRLRRSRVADLRTPWQADEWLIQLGLVTAQHGWLSSLAPDKLQHWQAAVSRFSGGEVEVMHDRMAPSRAHGKLVEAELQLAQSIQAGQSCVDLGASPGGWTYLAVQRGASVIAVDRSALRGDLMRHGLVTFLEADAFAYQPDEQVDWLLCDLIAFPDKTLELLTRWLENRWCRRFCVTIKFRRDEHYALLEDFKRLLATHTSHYLLRRLQYNKNEVTALGVVG